MNVLPLFAQAGITGFESPAAEYLSLPLNLDDILIDHPAASFVGRAVGDSMTGFGIFHGDILIVDRAAKASKQDIIVATLNGEFVCKLYDRSSHQLLSSHPDNQPYGLRQGDDFLEEGIVVRSIRNHRHPWKLPQCLR